MKVQQYILHYEITMKWVTLLPCGWDYGLLIAIAIQTTNVLWSHVLDHSKCERGLSQISSELLEWPLAEVGFVANIGSCVLLQAFCCVGIAHCQRYGGITTLSQDSCLCQNWAPSSSPLPHTLTWLSHILSYPYSYTLGRWFEELF